MHQPAPETERQRCFACGGLFLESDGPTHRYMLSTPGCWSAYGTLLAREYEAPGLFAEVHRLTVDAYALQHPGRPDEQRAVQSVWVHFAALYLVFEERRPHAAVAPVMGRLTAAKLPPLEIRPSGFEVTHRDVLDSPRADHAAAVRRWATCAYEAWAPLREPVRRLLAAL